MVSLLVVNIDSLTSLKSPFFCLYCNLNNLSLFVVVNCCFLLICSVFEPFPSGSLFSCFRRSRDETVEFWSLGFACWLYLNAFCPVYLLFQQRCRDFLPRFCPLWAKRAFFCWSNLLDCGYFLYSEHSFAYVKTSNCSYSTSSASTTAFAIPTTPALCATYRFYDSGFPFFWCWDGSNWRSSRLTRSCWKRWWCQMTAGVLVRFGLSVVSQTGLVSAAHWNSGTFSPAFFSWVDFWNQLSLLERMRTLLSSFCSGLIPLLGTCFRMVSACAGFLITFMYQLNSPSSQFSTFWLSVWQKHWSIILVNFLDHCWFWHSKNSYLLQMMIQMCALTSENWIFLFLLDIAPKIVNFW